MAVAVKNPPEVSSTRLVNPLAARSLGGAAYVLAGLALILYGLPELWWSVWRGAGLAENSPVGWALLILAMVVVAGVWVFAGSRLAGGTPVRGARAGTFLTLVGVLLALLVSCGVGRFLEARLAGSPTVGAAITLAIGVGLLGTLVILMLRGSFDSWCLELADQGWFTAAAYKRTQGQRVRRGTMLAILILVGCGIYTLLAHGTLDTAGDWNVVLPFTGGKVITLLPQVRFTLPLVIAAAALWLAYRVVNLPVFADFLIATEAELNKVSWTTRPRLIQDTIVVLVTVILLTIFLFIVDQAWAWTLTKAGVLRMPTTTAAPVQREQPW